MNPPGLTRVMQIGLGLLVLLVAIIGYRGFLRRHPAGRAWPERRSANAWHEHRASHEHQSEVRP